MHDWLVQIIFYFFAGLALFSALMVITQNNPVRCVLFLVLTFFAAAVLWLLLEAEFLALVLILVYVGAVMTLFLFVIMMLNIDTESIKAHLTRYLPFGLILVALLTGLLMVAVPEGSFRTTMAINTTLPAIETVQDTQMPALSNTEQLGLVLYTDYAFAFELAAVILLVAIIAAITLAQREIKMSKRQNVVKQMMTRKEDRVTLVKMKSERG